jgi:DNA-binding MarR family transcriptional regulator
MITSAPEDTVVHAIERFWETFPPVWTRIRGNLRLVLAGRSEVTVEQFQMLRYLRNGCRTASELSTKLQISRPAVSQVLDGLVEGGYVGRTHSVVDRRNIELELTQEGKRLIVSIYNDNRAWMKEKMACLTEGEIECVNQALEILKNTFCETE